MLSAEYILRTARYLLRRETLSSVDGGRKEIYNPSVESDPLWTWPEKSIDGWLDQIKTSPETNKDSSSLNSAAAAAANPLNSSHLVIKNLGVTGSEGDDYAINFR